MAISTLIFFCALLVGTLAALPPEDVDLSAYFNDVSHNPQGRIVGGKVAAPGSHPWMVAMTTGGVLRNMHCGGSIISQNTVLTAGHCIFYQRAGNTLNSGIRLHVGTNDYHSGGQTHTISGFAIHPAYSHGSPPRNDLSVLYTTNPIVFSSVVKAIPLGRDFVSGGVEARVAGWGRTTVDDTGPASQQLLELDADTVNSYFCIREAVNFGTTLNPSTELCSIHPSVGHGICSGDNGGPLVRKNPIEQIGIISWGIPCAIGGPDVYTRIDVFRVWIEMNKR